jgi:hypothetical protein
MAKGRDTERQSPGRRHQACYYMDSTAAAQQARLRPCRCPPACPVALNGGSGGGGSGGADGEDRREAPLFLTADLLTEPRTGLCQSDAYWDHQKQQRRRATVVTPVAGRTSHECRAAAAVQCGERRCLNPRSPETALAVPAASGGGGKAVTLSSDSKNGCRKCCSTHARPPRPLNTAVSTTFTVVLECQLVVTVAAVRLPPPPPPPH